MDKNQAIVSLGDINYLGGAFAKAETEKKLSIVYLGGSITQGCNASAEENRYVDLSAKWWSERFPDARISYFNAGIGATDSEYGVARLEGHVLDKEPDVVFVEFSVNDDGRFIKYKETYESLVRRLLRNTNVKAVVLINNLFYDTGDNAQHLHNAVGTHYQLPIVSVRDYIYPQILSGEINVSDYTDDMLHPKDLGHRTIAELICGLLDEEYALYKNGGGYTGKPSLPAPLTDCRYEDSQIFRNDTPAELDGFTVDTHKGWHFCDPFTNGWTASRAGSRLSMEVSGNIISIQWRRSMKKPAPVAYAIVDNDEITRTELDANFEETWGDKCQLTTLTETAGPGRHTVTVTVEKEGSASDFMLISVIAADRKGEG